MLSHGAGACDPSRPYTAHHRWTAILAAHRALLTTTTLANLLGDHSTFQLASISTAASAA